MSGLRGRIAGASALAAAFAGCCKSPMRLRCLGVFLALLGLGEVVAPSARAADATVPPNQAGRIVNLSVLTSIDAASGPDASLTLGFVVGGRGTSGRKPLLVRAGGPSLARFGVSDPLSDSRIELFNGATKIAENDNWGGLGTVAEITRLVAAFPFLSNDSRDSAVFSDTLLGGNTSVQVFGVGGATGSVIAEVYDATNPELITATTPRLINVSVLKSLRSGATVNAGFVISGLTNKTLLIRVIGPTLSVFDVAAPLADPRLVVFRAGATAPFVSNEDWGGGNELANTFVAVGAFGLAASSRDAVLLLTLEPGNYIAQASGAPGQSGTALVEIYEVQ